MKIDTALAVEALELDLLLEALYQRSGFDFRAYERTALGPRLRVAMGQCGASTLSGLQERILHQNGALSTLMRALSVQAAPLFADPEQIRLQRQALSHLHGVPLPRIWLADCAGPESAWAMAILLADVGMLARCDILATVATDDLLREVQDASIPVDQLDEYQQAYLKSGGKANLADFFELNGRTARPHAALLRRISWAQYNLPTDASPNEYELVMCGRALTELGPVLRQRVLHLFHASLARFGVLGLSHVLEPSDRHFSDYQPLFNVEPWYKRIA